MRFAALLQGSPGANTLAPVWQFFWLRGVLVLLHGLGKRASAPALLVELLQSPLPGRVPHVTPAFLP